MKRVVSLVPSWTETLIEAGVHVVGRTRFCVHPEHAREIPVVGGTKDLDLSALAAQKPELLVVDKEENLPWMAAANGWETHVTHVGAAKDLPTELDTLGKRLSNEKLVELGKEWASELARPFSANRSADELPGVLEWIRRPEREPERLLYLIWRAPWMTVSRDTFVGSLLAHLGYGELLPPFPQKYPKIELGDFDPARTLLLFSSEPFPFHRKRTELSALGFPCALVDGEAFSWFGLRSLRFLQRIRPERP